MCECNYTVYPCKAKKIQTGSEDEGKSNEPLVQEAPVGDQDKTNEILPHLFPNTEQSLTILLEHYCIEPALVV